MPKARTKSKPNHPYTLNSSFDIVLDTFIETGHFTLTDETVTSESLYYFIEYLNRQPKPFTELDYKLYLKNVIFAIETPRIYSQNNPREYADDELLYLLQEIFKFSPKWNVIALDKVTILQNKNYYPLSLNFIWRFGNQITRTKKNPLTGEKEKALIVTKALIITNAAFHSWVWIELLTARSTLDSLTIELLPNREQEENLAHLCDVLQYANINLLNLGNTEITVNGYRSLNQLLNKKPFIYKVLLRAPTDPNSCAILKENKARLAYLDQEKYLEGGWPLAKLDINQLAADETRTVGHWLLENALAKNDTSMVEYLIKAKANLLEQRGDEPPFLLQIFNKNRDFKLIILNHIIYAEAFAKETKHDLQDYPDSKEIIMKMENSLISYAEILIERTLGLLSGYEMLLNLLKTLVLISRPSQNRDQEFIAIYWRLYKCVILFHDAEGRVTVESLSNAQSLLHEIKTISKKAELGWNHGSKLHHDLPDRIDLLMKDINKSKELVGQANDEKDRVTDQAKGNTHSEELGLDEPGPSTRFFSRR